MSRLRVPVVVGLDRGVGASTVATALHADEGSDRDIAADVLVCGDLERAATVTTGNRRVRPLLAVTGVGPGRDRPAGLEGRFAAVVLLPHVERWAGLGRPADELVTLLGQPFDHLPRELQAYVAALRQLASGLVRSGQLTAPAPPALLRPRAVGLWRGLVPVERAVPVRPVLLSAPRRFPAVPVAAPGPFPAPGHGPDGGLDDDALEAACVLAGRAG